MMTLATFVPSQPRSSQSASLSADYARFVRHRRARRPFIKALTGFAAAIFIGAAVGTVPPGQAELGSGLCLGAAALLLVPEWIGRNRLFRRLNLLRAGIRSSRKS